MNKYMIKKEFHESLYESKGICMITAVSCILSGLCFLVLNIKEGSVLAQNDVLQYAVKAVMFLTLTVSMVLGASSLIAEREENTLESLLLTPISKRSVIAAKYLGVLLIGALLYIASVPYICAIGAGSHLTLPALVVVFFGGGILLLGFVAIAMILSVLMKSSKASVLTSVLIMIVLTLPALIKGILKLSAVGSFILKIDPVAACFDMMAKMLTDGVSVFALWNYILPLCVFTAAAMAALYLVSNHIVLKGEK